MNSVDPIRVSKALLRRLTAAIHAALEHRTNHKHSVAFWASEKGTLDLDARGYKALSQAADDLRKNGTNLDTYPKPYLLRVLAHAIIEFNDEAVVVSETIAHLNTDFHKQIAYVPFWGVSIEQGAALQIGPYRLKRLGKSGFNKEIVTPLRRMRSSLSRKRIAADVKDLKESVKHIPNVPVLTVKYDGSREGAEDFVSPIAEHVADLLQFVAAPLVERKGVRPIDHRGAYFGRFSTIMPVLSYDATTSELVALDRPNLRDNPYGPTVTKQRLRDFKRMGGHTLLPFVVDGPSRSDTPVNMLLRAIQLFADGERALTERQAIVSYVGACEAIFGHRDLAEKYTCTGISLAFGGDFNETLDLAKRTYDERSRAAHQGLDPTLTGPARRFAYNSIAYVIRNRNRFTSKRAIRAWIESVFS